ncbi:carbamoyltransferase [Amycolatopsis rubida]|uniref:Carbamoyltransferase n=1 Tax=Amycolatopsis rubida TaxID=112413 RepID=A0A1I5SB59_9PSEU|nr:MULTISPECIES: carbamoyltransferase N-terminal domain-containing protein [Amycolatopsis]MYW89288.1 carbamoyltransferase [Amycolatopsis rubida]NEC54266.1 carbamoyltransferase [Amycolatopsis rubida]OAP22836.1 Decarbamoylnovobiocin carbamoyltransferase [Amycolatopsis sp. M39]SFP67950.1 carbamoyltransferase [Amycolatopsis rubida]
MPEHEVICGLKLTHDGGFAVIEGNRLLVSVEAEKLGNNPRHSPFAEPAEIARQLRAHGIEDVRAPVFAVDGWARGREGESWVEIRDAQGAVQPVEVALYHDEPGAGAAMLTGVTGQSPLVGGEPVAFRSFTHTTDHVMSAYCTSPFAREREPALMLVWDGGVPPVLYRFDPAGPRLECFGPVCGVSGALYPIFASHFGPFRVDHDARRAADAGPGLEALLPVSGKAMAYAALGPASEEAIAVMAEVDAQVGEIDGAIRAYLWSRRVLSGVAKLGLSDASILNSFQEHLFRRLRDGLGEVLRARPELAGLPLCLSGGCALNIKWNSGLRASRLAPEVWVPPFPNDAGSAIGAACTEMVRRTGTSWLDWSVFAGPPVRETAAAEPGWTAKPASVEDLAALLAEAGEPVVIVDGPAELGPRALGHRSIIAPAGDEAMRDRLNAIKGREWYRPVAPVCLENRAPEVFSPGTRDPYMLFDHFVRPEWQGKIPAVAHLDGSARLETVGADNPLLERLLTAYEARTGIPVLCNTSANHPGRGFFPDAASAMQWHGTRHVWSAGTLYSTDAVPESWSRTPRGAAG